jgi:hypothetical protein
VSADAGAGLLRGRALKPFQFTDGGTAGGALDGELSHGATESTKKFDQFAANAKLTGRVATYEAGAYTTPLNTASLPAATVAEADRIASEIEAKAGGGQDGDDGGAVDDEEARFSAVGGFRATFDSGASLGADSFTDASISARGAGGSQSAKK